MLPHRTILNPEEGERESVSLCFISCPCKPAPPFLAFQTVFFSKNNSRCSCHRHGYRNVGLSTETQRLWADVIFSNTCIYAHTLMHTLYEARTADAIHQHEHTHFVFLPSSSSTFRLIGRVRIVCVPAVVIRWRVMVGNVQTKHKAMSGLLHWSYQHTVSYSAVSCFWLR